MLDETPKGYARPELTHLKTPAILIVAVIAIWLTMGIFAYSMDKPGEFGDMFGAVNALFSGLAFAVLIYTVRLQVQELSLQRDELRMTREELRSQKEEFSAQNKTLALQRFENTFFALLDAHNKIIDALDLQDNHSARQTRSRDCFKVFYNRLRNHIGNNGARPSFSNAETTLSFIKSEYEKLYLEIQHDVGHYFRHLYHIISFVNNHYIDQDDYAAKRRYTNLVRAQLSSHELTMLFYNCLSEHGVEKFKPLVEHYALLKNMDTRLLIDRQHADFYAPSAYGYTA
jgi:hypothetical protein